MQIDRRRRIGRLAFDFDPSVCWIGEKVKTGLRNIGFGEIR
jgi:hypothetical protein